MSKNGASLLRVLALFLLMQSHLNARAEERKDQELGSVSFSYTTKLKFSGSRSLRLFKSGSVFLNGFKMNPGRRAMVQPLIIEAFRVPKENPLAECAAGTYRYERIKDGKTRTVRGCMESPEFARLERAFQRL